MKQHQFVRPVGPLGPYASQYERQLVSDGHRFGSVQHRLTQFSQVSRWLLSEGLEANDLNEKTAQRFAEHRRAKGRMTWASPANMSSILVFLRSIEVVGPPALHEGPFEELLGAYRRYLYDERGLGDKSVAAYLLLARSFLCSVANRTDELAHLGAADVRAYLLTECRRQSVSSMNKTLGGARSLLAYLHVAAMTPTSLVGAVPKMAGFRQGSPLPSLSKDVVAGLYDSCDRRSGVGRRDYAILLLLGRLGLRTIEVTRLTLDDVDWHHGELYIRGKGDRHERLPLPAEVGAAIAAYLQRGRPKVTEDVRSLFLRSRAPYTPLGFGGTQTVVRYASQRCGLAVIGPRQLRRYAATQMHQRGMSLSAVAEVLRHHDIRVTTVYVDVDMNRLPELARVWPGSAR